VVLAYFVGPQFFPPFLVTKAQLALENPSAVFAAGLPRLALDAPLTERINTLLFSFTGTVVPQGTVTLLWDAHSAIPAFRFNILTLGTSAILIALDALIWFIPLISLSTYLVLVWFFVPLICGSGIGGGDVLLAAMSSGTLFAAFFLSQWPGTLPLSRRGKVCYACATGLLFFVFAGGGTSPVGAVFTVLAANMVSAVVQFAEKQGRRRAFETRMKPLIKEHWEALHR
jgi:electron transport complex protein RnfD